MKYEGSRLLRAALHLAGLEVGPVIVPIVEKELATKALDDAARKYVAALDESAKAPRTNTVTMSCAALAPVASNGGRAVSCSLKVNHDGDHSVTLEWG